MPCRFNKMYGHHHGACCRVGRREAYKHSSGGAAAPDDPVSLGVVLIILALALISLSLCAAAVLGLIHIGFAAFALPGFFFGWGSYCEAERYVKGVVLPGTVKLGDHRPDDPLCDCGTCAASGRWLKRPLPNQVQDHDANQAWLNAVTEGCNATERNLIHAYLFDPIETPDFLKRWNSLQRGGSRPRPADILTDTDTADADRRERQTLMVPLGYYPPETPGEKINDHMHAAFRARHPNMTKILSMPPDAGCICDTCQAVSRRPGTHKVPGCRGIIRQMTSEEYGAYHEARRERAASLFAPRREITPKA